MQHGTLKNLLFLWIYIVLGCIVGLVEGIQPWPEVFTCLEPQSCIIQSHTRNSFLREAPATPRFVETSDICVTTDQEYAAGPVQDPQRVIAYSDNANKKIGSVSTAIFTTNAVEKRLLFCSQYKTESCCTTEYTLLLREIVDEMELSIAPHMNKECYNYIMTSLCVLCDPGVGVGRLIQYPSLEYCLDIWDACANTTWSIMTIPDITVPERKSDFWIPDSSGTVKFEDPLKFYANATKQYFSVLYDLRLCAIYFNETIPETAWPNQQICYREPPSPLRAYVALVIGGVVLGLVLVILLITAVVMWNRKSSKVGVMS